MGLFGAMTTAVGGLRAQAFALENVSGNIANSQTTGFKRVDTSFADLVPDSTPQLQLAGGVLARPRGTNNELIGLNVFNRALAPQARVAVRFLPAGQNLPAVLTQC
jgi:flagellar basal body rod protein FlgG